MVLLDLQSLETPRGGGDVDHAPGSEVSVLLCDLVPVSVMSLVICG
ncbi:hypothetical protein GCM10027168_45460 [Streptomyces capparidis]